MIIRSGLTLLILIGASKVQPALTPRAWEVLLAATAICVWWLPGEMDKADKR